MIRDNELIFATATSPTTTNIALASNILDTGPLASSPFANVGNDLGAGEEMWLEILITTVGLSAASASQIHFELVTASASDLTSFTVLAQTTPESAPAYTVGRRIRLALPTNSTAYRRYLGVNCEITLGVLSSLAYSAYLVKQPDTYKAYAPGFKLDG